MSAVLRLCHSRGQPVVPHGGLTGLVYGTAARASELILSLEALNRIENVDVAGRTMRVQAGVTLQRAQEEAERFDLMFPLDLGGARQRHHRRQHLDQRRRHARRALRNDAQPGAGGRGRAGRRHGAAAPSTGC